MKLIPQDKRTILCSFSNEKGAIFNDGRGLSVSTFVPIKCPDGQPGDRLWVREGWGYIGTGENFKLVYKATVPPGLFTDRNAIWKKTLFMPRWASRITLEITDVRVERVQDISARDVESEGVDVVSRLPVFPPKRETLECLLKIVAHQEIKKPWDSINAKRGYSWDSNPWVWVIEFRASKL